jgi:hypothetical protein
LFDTCNLLDTSWKGNAAKKGAKVILAADFRLDALAKLTLAPLSLRNPCPSHVPGIACRTKNDMEDR